MKVKFIKSDEYIKRTNISNFDSLSHIENFHDFSYFIMYIIMLKIRDRFPTLIHSSHAVHT